MININLKELTKSIGESKVTEVDDSYSRDIAIIGISAKLPLAEDIHDFWNNLISGRNCITELPKERKTESDTYLKFKGKHTSELLYKKGSYLNRLDEFDCRFFNISPREASLMDPNQRLFLECAFSAIADAGYGGDKLKGSRTGIYYGYVSDMAYQRFIADMEPSSLGMSIPGNMASIIPGRVSYILDLKGPSLVIDTACSSSLVAVHTACSAIRNGDCEMALVGSGKISLLPLEDDNMLGIESKSYTCRAFDDDSDGTCMGEGIFAFLLKPLSKAKKDKDNIYAVIKGSAINQDGSSAGITAPNALAQADVIERAWKDAGIDPNTVTYIETHGTGTKLGDPIEIDGITRAFSSSTTRKQFCAIGSVKTNLGHLDSAAGMAGLLKVVLSLKNKMIPPSINFSKPNRSIQFQNTPVYVNHRLAKWESDESPRRCGVSAFGLSGTNCHIVLEEAPMIKPAKEIKSSVNVLTLSAKTEQSLKTLISDYIRYFDREIEGTLGNVCYSANTGSGHYNFRMAIVSKDLDELKEKLIDLKVNSIKSCETKGVFYLNCDGSKISESEQKRISEIANNNIQLFKNDEENLTVLNEICSLYIKGANILWNEFYLNGNNRRVSLPAYPFEKRRCWIEIPEGDFLNSDNDKMRATTDSLVRKAPDPIEKKKVTLKGRLDGKYSDTEIKLAQTWGEVLGFDELDINDDFYELGGDSLIAMKVISRINTVLNKNIKISELLEFQTINAFAIHIDNIIEDDNTLGTNNIPPILKLDNRKYYSLSSAQKRIYLIEQFSDAGTTYNMPAAVMIEGPVNKDGFEEVFKKLIARHEALRTSFDFIDEQPVQIIKKEFSFAMEYIESNENDIKDIINKLIRPFDLTNAPLFRASLVKIAEDKHVLFFEMHHIIADGFSYAILLREFKALYQSEKLPEMEIQYKDYSDWHNKLLETEMMIKQEEYWMSKYSGDITVLDMPLDYKRPQTQAFAGNSIEFTLDETKVVKMKEFAQSQGTTLNSVLLALYSLLLCKYSKQNEVAVGSLTAGRRHKSLENVIGMFVNFVPIKFFLNDESSFSQYLKEAGNFILEAYDNQDYPFDKIVEKVASKLDRSRNPLFDTVFIFHNEFEKGDNENIQGLVFSNYELDTKTSKLDFKIDAYLNESGAIKCVLEYSTSLFKEKSIQEFIEHLNRLMDLVMLEPDKKISMIELFSDDEKRILYEKRSLNSKTQKAVHLAVSATFTSEPIEDYIKWWCNQFNIDITAEFAPYNQVFQQLLDSESMLSKNDGLNLLLVRFEDWIRNDDSEENIQYLKLEENFEKLIKILENRKSRIPCFVGVYPVSTHLALSESMVNYIRNMNNRWKEALNGIENIHVIDFNSLDHLYGIYEIFDEKKDSIGHLPFSDEYFAAMGTFIARKICSWKRQQFKVIVLDCDNTLWSGICGEDGELGVTVDKDFSVLQKLMLEKYNSGMLLALCSKNNEQDVWKVFEKNPQMLLKKEHFVSWRINWQPKSENIKAMARELNLGLDSFIFIDDNPVECSQVMEECPMVLTIQLPNDTSKIPAFLEHIWAFDVFKVTEEDRSRTKMYVAEKKRQELQENPITLDEFINSLDLKMSINLLDMSQLGRVAQLTQRTNQFNLSTIRRTEEEIESLLRNHGMKCWVVEVADRFGDYGLVGVIITKDQGKSLFIDTFLLSCRVLGRGVENAILNTLGNYCKENNVESFGASFYPTQKNQPFKEFLERSNWVVVENLGESITYRLFTDKIPNDQNNIECYYLSTFSKEKPASESKLLSYPLDHIAIAVRDIEVSKEEYLRQGFKCSNIVYDPLQNAYLSMLSKDGHDCVELVAPIDSDSPVYRTIEGNGEIPYHLCYRTLDCDKFLVDLVAKGIEFEIISEAKQAVLFNYQKVTFIRIKDLGLIELLEEKEVGSELSEDKNIKLNVLQIIVSHSEKPIEFFKYMGYIQGKSVRDISKKIHTITLFRPSDGKIELIIPTDESTQEYQFFLKNGAHPYKLYMDVVSDGNYEIEENNWEVMVVNEENISYKNHLTALQSHSAGSLLKLPVYQSYAEKAIETKYQAPTNEMEERLVSIWQDILGVEKVGINDNFFELGGHSLKATILISRISKEFNIDISLTEVFRLPTVKKLISHMLDTQVTIYNQIQPAPKREYYPLSSAQKRIFLINQVNPSNTGYNLPVAFQIQGNIDIVRLKEVFRKLISRHEVLRTSFAFINGEPVQIVNDNFDFNLQYLKVNDDGELYEVVNSLIKPFDLMKPPLIRVCLIRSAEDKYILYYEMHHIIADGVSFALLINEFKQLYGLGNLPDLSIQYKDYSVWQNNLLETEGMKKQEKYWMDKYACGVPILHMPLDYKRQDVLSFEGKTLEFTISEDTITLLLEMTKKHGTTINSVLMSLYALLLSKYSGQQEVVVGSVVAGRRHASLENVMGVFINYLPIKFEINNQISINNYLDEAGKLILDAYENQDYPFDLIIENMPLKLDRSRNPLFDTVFILHNEFEINNGIEMDELSISNYPLDLKTSILDFKIDAQLNEYHELKCTLEYNTSLFKEETMQNFIMHFILLLDKAGHHQEQKIENFEIFTKFEKALNEEKLVMSEITNSTINEAAASLVQNVYVEPGNQIEKKLIEIWKDVLGKEEIGIHDNFFQLGGSSLKGVSIVSRVYKQFNVELSITDVFDQPTISLLAKFITGAGIKAYCQIECVAEKEYYPLSSAQKRLFLLNQIEANSIVYNELATIAIEGSVELAKLEATFIKLIKRHEVLRTSFEFMDDQLIQRVHKEFDFKVRLLESTEDKMLETIRNFIVPFDLSKANLVRVGLIKLSIDRYILVCDMHHIISDETSMGILIKEFISLYNGDELPELRLQYKDYSGWQNQMFKTEFMKKQEEFWLKEMSGVIPVLNLPTDFPRTNIQNFEGDNTYFDVDSGLVKDLNDLAKASETTLYMVLMAAFNILLFKCTSQEDIIIGTPVSGRPHVDLENIIGMFVNTLALRNYPQGNKTYVEFLKAVKENSLRAVENQDYQFEELVDKLNIARDLSRNPLFDVVFSFHNGDVENVHEVQGLRFSPYLFKNKTSKFDITLHVEESIKCLRFNFEYSTHLFKKETIERMGEDYLMILEAISKNNIIQIKDIKLGKSYTRREKAIQEDVSFDF